MKKITLAVMAIASLVGAAAASASEDGWYGLVGAGQASGSNARSTVDDALLGAGASGFSSSMSNPSVGRLEVGYLVNRNWAVEGGYLGSKTENYAASGGSLVGGASTSVSIKGWNLVAVGILPIANEFSLLARLGVADMEEKATPTGANISASLNSYKSDVTYGIGAQYTFPNAVFLRADVDSYQIGNSNFSNHNTVWTIDLGYKF